MSVPSFRTASGFVSGQSKSAKSTLLPLVAGVLGPSVRIVVFRTDTTRLSTSAHDRYRVDRIGFQTATSRTA